MNPNRDRLLLKQARLEKDRLEAGLSRLKCAPPHDSEKTSHRYSVNTPRRMRRASIPWGWFLVVFLWAVSPACIAAQTIRGVVVDSLTREPLGEAWVAHSGPEGIVAMTTGADGLFEVSVEGEPPFELMVRRVGYLERTLVVGSEDLPGEVRIGLTAAPFGLEGLEVEAERKGPDFRFGIYIVTDTGLVWPGHPEMGCFFVMIDSVVVEDYNLLRPSVYERYERAQLYTAGLRREYWVKSVSLMRKYVSDSRLRHDAWPCGVHWLMDHERMDLVRRLPAPPTPEGQPIDLAESASFPLPVLSSCPGSIAVSREGDVALVARGEPQVRVFGPDGQLLRSLDAELPGGAGPCSLRVGWRGDTLWVADRSRNRLNLYAGEGPPVILEGMGLPESIAWNSSQRALPSSPLETDLPVPVPVAGDQFLWTFPAPDPPSPPIHPDDPPGRMLVVLDDEWKLKLVLDALRPGAAAVDVVLGSAPVLGDQPFTDHPLYQMSPDGSHVTIVRREHQMAAWMTVYRVTRVNMEGDTLFTVERRASMIRTDDETFDSTAAELAALPGAVEAFPGPVRGRQALIRGMLNRPPFHPPISDLLVGFDGTTWLRWPDTREGDVRWEVLDPSGEPQWTFEADRRLELVAANGEEVWGLLREDQGAIRLIRFRLHQLEVG